MNKSNLPPINIIILGSGFAAIEALKKLQKKYKRTSGHQKHSKLSLQSGPFLIIQENSIMDLFKILILKRKL